MPTYDYRCTECGREVEVMHGIHASGPESCEHCGGAMRKALSPPAIHFKGKGWAKKDAAAATAKKAKPKAGTKGEKDDSKGDSKGDSKPTTDDGAKSDAGATSATSSDSKGQVSSTAGSKTD